MNQIEVTTTKTGVKIKPVVEKAERYGSYIIRRFSQAGMCTISLTKEAQKKGKVLADVLTSSKYTDLVSARKAIDKYEGKPHSHEAIIIYSNTGHDYVNESYKGEFDDWK